MRHYRLTTVICLAILLLAGCTPDNSGTATPKRIATPYLLPTVTAIGWRPVSDPISIGNAPRLARIGSLIGHNVTVNKLSFAHKAPSLLSQDGSGLVFAWDLQTGQLMFTMKDAGAVRLATYSADDQQIITVGFDNQVRSWKAADGAPISTIALNPAGLTFAVATADGSAIAVGHNDGTVWVWRDFPVHQPTYKINTAAGHLIRTMAFSANGKQLATIATDNQVKLWDGATGAALTTLPTDGNAPPIAITYSPDGALLSVSAGFSVSVYDTATYAPRFSVTETDLAGNLGMGFSSDSHYLAAGSIGNFVYVWQVRDGLRVARLPGHDSQFNGLAWSPLVATPLLLTASPGNNGGAYIWNAQTFAPTADSYQRGMLSAPGEPINNAFWSPDGKRIITADIRGSMTLWGIPMP
jgi:WD40 repeat protein